MKTTLISLGLIFLIISFDSRQQGDRATDDKDEKIELKGINFVLFDFKEGDHGLTDVYNRNSLDKNRTITFKPY